MKYRELPASETNDFEVGDRVRVYNWASSLVIKVEKVNDDWVESYTPADNNLYKFHFKQCRKLVEEKPRQWVLCQVCNVLGETTKITNCKSWCVNPRLIRLQEVLQ